MKKAIASIILLVGLMTALTVARSRFNAGEDNPFQNALSKIKSLDAAFDQNLLKARFSMLNTYDDFEDDQHTLQQTLLILDKPPSFVDAEGRAALHQTATAYRALLETRERLFEHFKSQNAIVANARRYLPLVADQLNGSIGNGAADRELAGRIDALNISVTKLLSSDEADNAEALARADWLRDWVAGNPGHAEAPLVASLERTAHTLISATNKLDALTRQILSLPTAASVETLSSLFQNQVAAALERTRQYRIWLYVVCALLISLIGYALMTMRSANRRLEQRVGERTAELGGSEQRFRILATAAPIGIFLSDAAGEIIYTNPCWQNIAGLSMEQSLGRGWMSALHPDDAEGVINAWGRVRGDGDDSPVEFRFRTPDGQVRHVLARTVTVRDEMQRTRGHVGTVENVTERLRIAAELHQAQKLESVGRLAAGVAHEINTPVQFVNDSCSFVRDGVADLQGFMLRYRSILDKLAGAQIDAPQAIAELGRAESATDMGYLLDNMPVAIERALDGLQRITTIVRSMKEFAHPDQKEMVHADLNQAIMSTLVVARTEYKYVATLETDLGELPPVRCYLGDLNQAILNILVNAAHAIGDVVGHSGNMGQITVRTRHKNGEALISIQDSGKGIPRDILDKIFDPFFTTKGVGKGTGQGLAIARSVVVDKHHGSIDIDTHPGQGTTFTLRIPVEPAAKLEALAA